MPTTDPLTDAEKLRLRRWFGYPGAATSIDSQLNAVTGALATEARALYDRIDAIEVAEDKIGSRGGQFTRVEDVEFRGAEGAGMASQQRARLVRQLALLLDVELAEGGMQSGGGISCGPIWRA